MDLLRRANLLIAQPVTTREDYRTLLQAAHALPHRERSLVIARIYYVRLSRALLGADEATEASRASFSCHLAIGLAGCGLIVEAESFFDWGWRLADHPAIAPLVGEYCAALDAEDAFPELLRWSDVFVKKPEIREGERLMSRFLRCRALAGVGRTGEAHAMLNELREAGSKHPIIGDIERLLASSDARAK